MSERLRDCTSKCPMYRLNQRGCTYKTKGKGDEVEKIEPGQRCLYQEFDIAKYIELWAKGLAGDLGGRRIKE